LRPALRSQPPCLPGRGADGSIQWVEGHVANFSATAADDLKQHQDLFEYLDRHVFRAPVCIPVGGPDGTEYKAPLKIVCCLSDLCRLAVASLAIPGVTGTSKLAEFKESASALQEWATCARRFEERVQIHCPAETPHHARVKKLVALEHRRGDKQMTSLVELAARGQLAQMQAVMEAAKPEPLASLCASFVEATSQADLEAKLEITRAAEAKLLLKEWKAFYRVKDNAAELGQLMGMEGTRLAACLKTVDEVAGSPDFKSTSRTVCTMSLVQALARPLRAGEVRKDLVSQVTEAVRELSVVVPAGLQPLVDAALREC
jgi:hypothetical protein